MEIRALARDELAKIWEIDRREVIDAIYYLRDGSLVLVPEHYDMEDWPPGEPERTAPQLEACFDRGGIFEAALEGEDIVAVMVLDRVLLGPRDDQLQLKLLHVSRDSRGQGLGRMLFERAAGKARRLGARGLYISATPSENTVRFYLNRGCVLADPVDPALHELEPDDIHLMYDITGPPSPQG